MNIEFKFSIKGFIASIICAIIIYYILQYIQLFNAGEDSYNSNLMFNLLISFIGNSSKVGSDVVYNMYLNVKLFFYGLLMSYFVKIVISLLHTFLETTLNTSKYILYTLFFEIFITGSIIGFSPIGDFIKVIFIPIGIPFLVIYFLVDE
jgi:hypothetical protein